MAAATGNSKSDRILAGVDVWCSFYRANIHRFVKDFLGIKLKLFQQILLTLMNDNSTGMFLGSRGLGKTFLTAVYCVSRAILYPGTTIVVAAKTRKQGRELIGKITSILMPQSSLLRDEIEKITDNQYNTVVDFKNSSVIMTVCANENARGARAHILILDESRLLDVNIVNGVLRKFLIVPRHCGYMDTPEYEDVGSEDLQELHLTSAWYSSSWCYELFRSMAANMVNGRKYFTVALPYQLAIKEHLLERERVANEMSESTFNEVSWLIEMCAEFFEGTDGSLYSHEDITPSRQIKYAFYPPEVTSLVNDKKIKVPPKMHNERRIMSVDVALMASSSKKDNDATAIMIDQMILGESSGGINSIAYTESNEGLKTEAQALRIRKLFQHFDCDTLVIDARGVGLGVLDRLLDDIYDPETGVVYGGLSCYNNSDIAERCTIKGAPKVIYAVLATKDFNSTIALGLRESFRQGKIRLLNNEDDFDEYANDIVGYAKLPLEDRVKFRLPYINTSLLITELVSLQYETKNGVVAVKERSNMRKDRFSSLAYCIEVAKEIERDYVSESKKKTFQDYVLQFKQPIITKHKGR